MKRLHTLTALVLVMLWAPITWHCKLERIPGLEFLHCSSDTPSGTDCEGDNCKTVESVAYKLSDDQAVDVAPNIYLDSHAAPSVAEDQSSSRKNDGSVAVAGVKSELRTSWQFRFRTALPPRAPSLAS